MRDFNIHPLCIMSQKSKVFSLCSLQAVNQDLIAAPLVPPQLTAKDFYMTGKCVIVETHAEI